MKNDFRMKVQLDRTPEQVYAAVNDVKSWWTEINGQSQSLNDEFSVQFGDVHYSKQRLIEMVPGKRVVWLVTDSKLNFLQDKSEWTGTKIVFDIEKTGEKTQLTFTHEGLKPEVECYDACTNAWSGYVQQIGRS